jgi:2'-5' RNA ligase
MRLFTAIDLPAEVKQHLAELIDRLRPTAPWRWSSVENLHITTKFIGEWPEARLAEMRDVLFTVKAVPIDIEVRGLGWFPNAQRPRVFWAGVEGGEPLQALARDTEAAVAKLGVAVEPREYTPHLTIARVPNPLVGQVCNLQRVFNPLGGVTLKPTSGLKTRCRIQSCPTTEFGCFRAADFHLYLSTAGHYTKLETFPL